MICPQCQSNDVLAERRDRRWYRGRYYSGIAMVLDHLDHIAQEQTYREDGALCECMNCGFKWRPKQVERQKRYAQILTQQLGAVYWGVRFKSPDGSILQLEEDAVSLFFSKGRNYIIAFSELAAVSCQESLGPLYGWLTIRDRIHAKRRMPWNFKQAKKDRYTIFCDFGYEKDCYQTYLALQKIVEENKKAGLI